ncbi:MAG: KamA family radical SAM protein [Bdellovibrionota bacterium]
MGFTFLKTAPPKGINESDWNSWSWQLRSSLKTEEDFKRYFELTSEEEKVFGGKEVFNIRTTPYYAALTKPSPFDPLRRILMPHAKELAEGNQQMLDPLGERKTANAPTARVIHRYSDRALFLITDLCSVYCRYCTRKHFTGQDQAFIRNSEYDEALSYIKKTTGLKEIILSGGDPLTVSNSQLDRVLTDLRSIDHVEIIRIGTRMPVVCPQRIDEDLVKIIRKNKPVFLMTHFNHPRELTEESARAVELFVDNGVPVMNQMVLLNGVNNHPAIVQALSRRLLFLRAKPYYMFQCDPSIGTDHLRTSVDESLEIQRELWGHLSGLAMPTLSLDIPDGGGKTYLVPNFQTEITPQKRKFTGWDGVNAEYVNPPPEQKILPLDVEDYMEEWMEIKSSKALF